MIETRELTRKNETEWTELQVTCAYRLGGENWFSGQHQERGYIVRVEVVEVKQREDYKSYVTVPTNNAVTLVQAAARYSAGTHAKVAKSAKDTLGDRYTGLVQHVLTKNGF